MANSKGDEGGDKAGRVIVEPNRVANIDQATYIQQRATYEHLRPQKR